MDDAFFDGFVLQHVDVGAGKLRLRHSDGMGKPPLLLLHGNPQTHAMWHMTAPTLAERFHVICPDLRGYGGSFKPAASDTHAPYAKREMAGDMARLMTHFGYEEFDVAGHDRGGRVSHRLALDHGARVKRLAILDIVPTLAHFELTDMAFAMGYYHWFWFAQPHPFPESVINAAPDIWFNAHISREPKPPEFFKPRALADYMEWVRKPETIVGMCEDYRAAATLDLELDRKSRDAGDKITCPLLILWGADARIEEWYDALSIWKEFAVGPVSGHTVPGGHYLPEEAPEEVIQALMDFFD
ncbi:MAG: alpha/beta fold hydrolase [Hyphomicrobiaceae bacterium]